jgi:hypothetical protein
MDVVTAGAPCQVPVPNQLDRMDNQKLVGHLVGAGSRPTVLFA